jgi:hypothetical protein
MSHRLARRGLAPSFRTPLSLLLLAGGIAGGAVLAFPSSGRYVVVGIGGVRLARTIRANQSIYATVFLTSRPATNQTVTLGTGGPLTAPGTAVVLAGENKTRVLVTAGSVGVKTDAFLTASLAGTSKKAPTSITPARLTSVGFQQNPINGGAKTVGSVAVAERSASDRTIDLASDNPHVVVPPTVVVKAGQTRSEYFPITSSGVDNAESALVTASYGAVTITNTLFLSKAQVTEFISAASVRGGRAFRVTVKLSGRAGPSGRTVQIVSDDTSAIPSTSITIAPGQNQAYLRVGTLPVASTKTVHLAASGLPATVTVNP